MPVSLAYGHAGRFTCPVEPPRLVALRHAPAGQQHTGQALRSLLSAPLDFPPLVQTCIPGDRVVLALDRHTPQAAELLAAVWGEFARRDISAESVAILQPAAIGGARLPDPRGALPSEVARLVRWIVHDPTDPAHLAYLATTARGERIYLARELVDADVVVSIGTIAYDPLLGYRGTSSVLYPGLSTTEAIVRARGEGHSELGPDDDRPLRQTIDEVAWLLGTQFSIQVIPSGGAGAAEVLAGAGESVFRRGKELLSEHWRVRLDERAEIVVAAVDADAAGHGWDQIGAALATARNLVAKGGKIVLLTELAAEPGDGLDLIRQSRSPRNALKPIRTQAPADMIPATQLAAAADWAHVYLLSRLAPDVVDELFMVPLESEREAERLLQGDEPCVVLESAQHAYGEVQPRGVPDEGEHPHRRRPKGEREA